MQNGLGRHRDALRPISKFNGHHGVGMRRNLTGFASISRFVRVAIPDGDFSAVDEIVSLLGGRGFLLLRGGRSWSHRHDFLIRLRNLLRRLWLQDSPFHVDRAFFFKSVDLLLEESVCLLEGSICRN